jgi:hypothetical protein
MSAPNAPDDDQFIPELGDIITVISTILGRLTGKIIYRDENLVRLLPTESSNMAQDLPMDDDGGFSAGTGITEMIMHTKRAFPHFSQQLGAAIGEKLEFFTFDGQIAAPPGLIVAIEADENDAIVLQDGRRLDFAFIGPPNPIAIVSVRAADIEDGAAVAAAVGEDMPPPDNYDLSLLAHLLPARMIEEVPTAERTYSETIQREDMYKSLLELESEKFQNNPNVLRKLARETDLLLALKNAVSVTGDDGIPEPYIKSAETLRDILTRVGAPLSSIVPVLALKRILYCDKELDDEPTADMLAQVDFRNWLLEEIKAHQNSAAYLAGQNGGTAQVSTQLYRYLYDVLYNEGGVFKQGPTGKPEDEILVDQEILRTVLPPAPVTGYSKLENGAEVTYKNVGSVMTRGHRVIGGTMTKDQDVVAPGDPATPLNYIVLPVNLGTIWRPVKFSGALSEDINAALMTQQLLTIENFLNKKDNYNEDMLQVIQGVPTEDEDDASDVKISDWIAKNLDKHVHPLDILSSSAVGVNRVLDSIGLRSYEWTPEIANSIWLAVAKAQASYTSTYTEYKTRVEDLVKAADPYQFVPGVPADSTLYTKGAKVKVVGDALEALAALDPVKGTWDLARAQYVLQNAEGTLARVLYMAAADEPNPALEEATAVYLSEVHRTVTRLSRLHAELTQYSAAPILNTCKHVSDKDRLRSVMMRDQNKFEALLQIFLKRYQGETNGNWIECNTCQTHLICVHEVMQFYERTHPGRAEALHKEIILNFGGAAFNGKYVCRVCGIPIAEFEYDTSLEYDDNGRPLVGRAIIEDDKPNAEEELDAILNIALKKEKVEFEDPVRTELYDIARIIVQSGGFSFEIDAYRKIVEFTFNYIVTTIPPKDIYEAMRAKMKKRPMVPWESFRASTAIAITAAYIITEIHVMDPMPEALFPFSGCVFSRGGFPIEATDDTTGGAFEYFVCMLANIGRNTEPWSITSWYGDSSPDSRKTKVRDSLMKIFADSIMSVELRKAQHHYVEVKRNTIGNASLKDRLPNGFRPTANPNPPIMGETALTYPDRILSASVDAPLQDIQVVVAARTRQLALEGVLAAHGAAKISGIINEKSPMSDSTCCFLPIQDVKRQGMAKFGSGGTEDEIHALHRSETIIQKRDPVEQSNGTHLYVHWSQPTVIASKAVEPDASYFKLFLRTCFRGPREGELHEFGKRVGGYQCRHCKFACKRDPVVIMSELNDEEAQNKSSKVTKTTIRDEAQKALEDSGATIIGETFDTLLSEVRNNRNVDPYVAPVDRTAASIFEELSGLVQRMCPLTAGRMADWAIVEEIMTANFARRLAPTDEQRAISWAPFALKYESLSNAVMDLLDGRQGRAPVRGVERKVKIIIDTVEAITVEPIHQGPSEVIKHWVVGLERLAQGFNEMVFASGTWFGRPLGKKTSKKALFDGTKWFGKKISGKHAAKFETMIQTILGTTAETNKVLSKKAGSGEMLHRLSLWLGRVVNFWANNIISMNVWGLTHEELSVMLRWMVLSSMETLLLIESPLYTKIPTEGEKTSIQQILRQWTTATFVEAGRQFAQFGLSNDEILLAIEDAREKEKNSVIKEIDDEKDPDLRAVIDVQRALKIGRWGMGNKKNMTTYNAEFFDFRQEQLDRIGKLDKPVAAREDPLGFDFAAEAPAERWLDGHGVAEAEDEGAEV